MKTLLHEDRELTAEWLIEKGLELGKTFFYNVYRDNSGNFDGFAISAPGGDSLYVKTCREADIAIQWLKSQLVLRHIREAGNNTSDWATWAQRWAAHAMRPTFFPEPAAEPPQEEYKHEGFMELRAFPSGARFVQPLAHQCEGDSVPVYTRRTENA